MLKLLLTLGLALVVSAATGGISINQEPAYTSLRPCAKGCICCANWRPELMIEGLGCGEPWLNNCFCRTDQNSIATRFLSSCIYSRCTVGDAGPDFTSAAALYGSYCSAAGYPGPGVVFATPTGGDGSTTPTVTRITIVTHTVSSGASGSIFSSSLVTTISILLPTIPKTVDATSTVLVPKDGNPDGGGGGGGGLSLSDKIALGIGIGIGLPAAIAAIATCFHQMSR